MNDIAERIDREIGAVRMQVAVMKVVNEYLVRPDVPANTPQWIAAHELRDRIMALNTSDVAMGVGRD